MKYTITRFNDNYTIWLKLNKDIAWQIFTTKSYRKFINTIKILKENGEY